MGIKACRNGCGRIEHKVATSRGSPHHCSPGSTEHLSTAFACSLGQSLSAIRMPPLHFCRLCSQSRPSSKSHPVPLPRPPASQQQKLPPLLSLHSTSGPLPHRCPSPSLPPSLPRWDHYPLAPPLPMLPLADGGLFPPSALIQILRRSPQSHSLSTGLETVLEVGLETGGLETGGAAAICRRQDEAAATVERGGRGGGRGGSQRSLPSCLALSLRPISCMWIAPKRASPSLPPCRCGCDAYLFVALISPRLHVMVLWPGMGFGLLDWVGLI